MSSIENLKTLLDTNKVYKKIIEIGCKYGESAEYILNHYQVFEYIIIDPFESYPDYEIDDFNAALVGRGGEQIYERMFKKFQQYPNAFILRDYSENVYHLFDDESVDLVFVDGNHREDYVYNDIKNYYPKVRVGGMICGDDYYMRSIANGGVKHNHGMVYEGVTKFFKEEELILLGEHRGFPYSWAKIKEKSY